MEKRKEKSELERLRDFKLYVFEWEIYVKAEDYKEIAIENKKLNIKVASLEWEIKWLNSVIDKLHNEIEEQEAEWGWLFDEIDYRKRECKTLKEKVRFLEECLDRKEKLNEKYRKEIEELKSTYIYDAKQVRDIC